MKEPLKSVTVYAPATVANVGSAFDVLGFALEAPGDSVTATLLDRPGIAVTEISGIDGVVPIDTKLNTASVAAEALLNHLSIKDPARFSKVGVALSVKKGLTVGSGLGSSSASAVGGVVATNELLGSPLSRLELLPFAMEGERAACGVAHADNVAPGLFGGFALIRSYSPLEVIQLPCPDAVFIAVVSPQLVLRTADARKVLKRTVPLEAAIAQWGNVAALIAGIYRNDPALIGRALEDYIIEPERSQLIPGFKEVKESALAAGALGCAISGSGPALFALCDSLKIAQIVAQAMDQSFMRAAGIASTSFTSLINKTGAVVTATQASGAYL